MTLPAAEPCSPLRSYPAGAVALPNEKRARGAATPHAQTTTTQEVIPVHSNCSTARVSRPPVVCMACAQWDDDQRPDDDGELVAAFGSQAVFGVGR